MNEFNTDIPSVRQIQNYIKDKQIVEIKLNIGEMIEGNILWQDNHCLCLMTQKQQKLLLWKQSFVYIKAKG